MGDVFGIRARFDREHAAVWHALTDPASLRAWLGADHVEVALAENRFAFWGRRIPQGAPGRQRLLSVSPDHLGFQWVLDDRQTTVDLQLSAADGGTSLVLRQDGLPTLDELMSPDGRRDGRHTMHTFWPLAIGNLAELLAGRDVLPGTDFGEERATEIRVVLTIDAPASEVFASLTEPELVERWWGYAPEIEPRVGGAVTFGGRGRVTEFDEGRVFAYAEDGMVTRWELAESDGRTTLTFVQSGFGPDELDNAAQHEAGWRGGLLELRRMHELGAAWERASSELPE
ncbi:SRPBCC family protein [Actinophytocola gossypii]|uniref:SRPBCC domain-containing protein n=1 Tax=Actinophytocola gossypii TaxID=2812003 RepID=A0ABT2JC34_9PSEU|nr:SRPBCC domain-containing protein [Actinophytocola gossypii]MCT2585434.1 SRPBCC domain-containing protein [Actinophytocola gossypii]